MTKKNLRGSEFIVLSHFAVHNVEKFRQINSLTLLSRNFCQKCVRLNRSSNFPQILRWKLNMESYSAPRVLTRILQLDFTKYEFNFYLRVKLSLTNSMKQFRNNNWFSGYTYTVHKVFFWNPTTCLWTKLWKNEKCTLY